MVVAKKRHDDGQPSKMAWVSMVVEHSHHSPTMNNSTKVNMLDVGSLLPKYAKRIRPFLESDEAVILHGDFHADPAFFRLLR